jgi:Protein of unknown function (DUF3237)
MHLQPLISISVEVDDAISAGVTPIGEVRLIRFTSGAFEGDGLRGRLLPGGTDWQQLRADGVLEIRAHYLLETDGGETIEVVSEGLRHASPEVLARIANDEAVDPAEYYFRTHVRFRTASARIAHLNRLLAVSAGTRRARSVHLRIFAVP